MSQPHTTQNPNPVPTAIEAAAMAFLERIAHVPVPAAQAAQAHLYAYETRVSTEHDQAHGAAYAHALHLIGGLPTWYALNDVITTHLHRILGSLDWLGRAELATPIRDATLAAAATTVGLPRDEADVLTRAWTTACVPHLHAPLAA